MQYLGYGLVNHVVCLFHCTVVATDEGYNYYVIMVAVWSVFESLLNHVIIVSSVFK